MRRNVLEVKDLVRNYRKSVIKESEEDVKVLKGINFQVAEGEFVGIMGKSGCGKTTLLKTLGMIDKPTDGTIKFMGEDTSELYGDKLADIRNSKIGFIFQDFYLMDSLSVEENIMLPMIIIVMVTHDPQMASYCSRLILLKDGVILEDLKNSGNQDAFYQEILGKMKEL